MRGRLCFGWLGACAAASLFFGACDDGAPPARGFGSHQVLQVRDAALTFVGNGPGYVLYGMVNDDGAFSTFWRLDVETGALEDLGPSPSFQDLPPSRYTCTQGLTDTALTFTVTDTQTGVQTTIDEVATYTSSCPTDADPSLTLWRNDGDGHLALWTGRYDDLQRVPLPLLIDTVVSWGGKQAIVVAEPPEAPGGRGIFGIDSATYAVSQIVPPTLAAAGWAEGATPVGSLESASVANPDTELSIGQLGGNVLQLGGNVFYARTMSDGGTTVFVSPIVPASAELALFRVEPGATLAPVSMLAPNRVPTTSPAWQYESGSADLLLFWDAGTERMISCPGLDMVRPIGHSNIGGRQFLIGPERSDSGPIPGPLLLVSPDGDGRDGQCTRLADERAYDQQMSPDGALAWLLDVPEGSALWTAADNGTGAREIGRGSIEAAPWAPYFYAPSRLELRLARDLAWLDVHDDPVKLHYVAEQVFGLPLDYDRYVLIGYAFNDQDGTGRLGIVERETGDKRLISPEVLTYEATIPSSVGSPVRHYIVYLVRGRNPSSQDGLWVAAITQDDVR